MHDAAKVTDIAHEARTDRRTVVRFLQGKPLRSAATREALQRAAERFGLKVDRTSKGAVSAQQGA